MSDFYIILQKSMWKSSCQSLTKPNSVVQQFVRCVNNSEIAPRYKRVPGVGWWRRKGSRQLYPTSNPQYLRQIGVDLSLQERLDEMFEEEHAQIAAKKINIGFPAVKGGRRHCSCI